MTGLSKNQDSKNETRLVHHCLHRLLRLWAGAGVRAGFAVGADGIKRKRGVVDGPAVRGADRGGVVLVGVAPGESAQRVAGAVSASQLVAVAGGPAGAAVFSGAAFVDLAWREGAWGFGFGAVAGNRVLHGDDIRKFAPDSPVAQLADAGELHFAVVVQRERSVRLGGGLGPGARSGVGGA